MRILSLRGGILMSTGNLPGILPEVTPNLSMEIGRNVDKQEPGNMIKCMMSYLGAEAAAVADPQTYLRICLNTLNNKLCQGNSRYFEPA